MAFRVPFGYTLVIDGIEDKQPGEMSGGKYGLREVLDGMVEGWQLVPTQEYSGIAPFSAPDEIYNICDSLSAAGGNAIFAGGVVRDSILGYPNKDIDVEVYGMDADSLVRELSRFGRVDTVGASFGVIKLTTETGDYDFSLPRRENKVGVGHKDFEVIPDSNLTYEEAAARRDYTMNAVSMTTGGRLIDYFGGYKDMRDLVLRHTSDRFGEDALRVLRGFQFAARFGMRMDAKTADICRELKSEYSHLPKERVWTEWEKWATKGKKPSYGLQVLRDTGWIELYPEIFVMENVPQEYAFHPEGNVGIHTSHVVDAAAEIADRENLNSNDRLILLLAALCHDMGKPATTVYERGAWRAPGHDQAGEEPTRKFLTSIGAPTWVIENVVPLVVEHMAHVGIEMTDRIVRRIANRVSPSNIKMLSYVIEADHSGRPPLPKELPEEARKMVSISERLSVSDGKPKQLIGGRDLFRLAEEGILPEAYLKPGAHFGTLLSYLYEAQLDGRFTTMEQAEDFLSTMFDLEARDRMEDTMEFIKELSYMRLSLLIESANEQGMSEKELLSLPIEKLKQMAKLISGDRV